MCQSAYFIIVQILNVYGPMPRIWGITAFKELDISENANNKPGAHNATERLCEVVSLHLESTSHVQALYKVYSKVISTMTLR